MVLSGPDAMVVARWFLKTWLLLAHSAARESAPEVTPGRWDSGSDDLYGWMVTNQPPPTGLSIWVTRRAEEGPEPAVTRHIPLPTVVADGRTIQFRAKRAGVQFLDVSLVYHPGWEIEHPLEAAGRALRLWPRVADAEADFASLPPVHSKDMGWLKGPTLYFLPGARWGVPTSRRCRPPSTPWNSCHSSPVGEGGRSPQRAWPQEQRRLGSLN